MSPDRVYLDGNSLGPPTAEVRAAVVGVLDDWESLLIDGWNDAGWLDVEREVATRLAPLLGTDPTSVTCTDSTSVDLFQALAAAVRLRPDRSTVLVEDHGFPTDRYVAEGLAELAGRTVRAVAPGTLADEVDDDVAVVSVAHVDFHTGRRVDLARLTSAAHDAGALLVADLAHAAGAVDVALDAWDVDLAVGCTYKFLNGGPGAPGWLYANARLHDDLRPAIRGWFGHAAPFDFDQRWTPAAGASRFRNGTPPILSMSAVAAALRAFEDRTPAGLDARAQELTARFLTTVEAAGLEDLTLLSPRDPSARGAQLSFHHDDAWAVVRAMHARGVVGDHRPPDVVRLGFAPLHLTDAEVDHAAEVMVDVIRTREYEDDRFDTHGIVP